MIALDPNETTDVWLPRYDDKPEAERPALIVRHMRSSEHRKYRKAIAAAEEATRTEKNDADGADAIDARLDAALQIPVVGWKNVFDESGKPIPFSHAELSDIPTPREKWMFLYSIVGRLSLSESDIKKLPLPLNSDGEPTAVSVQPASA